MVIVVNLIGTGIILYLEDASSKAENRSDELVGETFLLQSIVSDHLRWKLNVVVSAMNLTKPKVQIDGNACRLGKFLKKVVPESDEERRIIQELKTIHQRMHHGAEMLQRLFMPGSNVDDLEDAYVAIYNKEIQKPSKRVFQLLAKLQDIYRQRAEIAEEQLTESSILLRNANIATNVLIMAIAVIFGWWSIRSVSRPIQQIQQGIGTIAEGDFTRDLKISGKDEMAELASSINNMLSSLRPLIKRVADGATIIEEEVEKMDAFSQKAAKGGEAAAIRAEDMLNESRAIVESVEVETQAINEISSAIQEISQSTAQANNITNTAVEKANDAGDIINRLGQVSNDVQGIIKLISDIAEQTNLLALNATIEAARAGEAGKGFAVVANEVKELAKQTANSTEEITSKINAMQTESQAAITVTSEITGIVDQINDITSTIAAAVEEQTAVISDIATKVDEQNVSAQHMATEAQAAVNAAKDAKEAALTNMEKLRNLIELAKGFKENTAQFRV